jgi:hypothetical protein
MYTSFYMHKGTRSWGANHSRNYAPHTNIQTQTSAPESGQQITPETMPPTQTYKHKPAHLNLGSKSLLKLCPPHKHTNTIQRTWIWAAKRQSLPKWCSLNVFLFSILTFDHSVRESPSPRPTWQVPGVHNAEGDLRMRGAHPHLPHTPVHVCT